MADKAIGKISVGSIVNVALPLFLLALLIALCVQLLLPFVGLLVWTIILAICFKPLAPTSDDCNLRALDGEILGDSQIRIRARSRDRGETRGRCEVARS